ncbi:MAG: hypothetical protein LBO66_01420, partial [Deltaproteobacteria bacterium]|nr:hypothetical protein [Deltaproteobacteria bacterium]
MAEDREERDPILVDDEALESGKSEPREGVLGGDDIPDDNDESWYEEEDGESQPEYGSLKKSVPVLKIVSLVLVLLLAAVVIFFHGRDDSVSPDPNAQSAAPQSALPAPAQAEPLTAALNVPLNEPAAPRPEPTIPSSPDPVLNFSPQEEPPAEASPTALNLTPVDTSDPAEAPEDPSRSFYPLNPTAPPETYQSAGPPAVAPPRVIPLLANASEPEALGPGSLSGTLAPEMMAFDERGGSRMTPAGEISSDLVPAEPVALSGGDTLTAPAEATPRVIPPQGEGPIVAEPPNDLPPPPTAPPVAGGEPLGAATPASPEPATQATSPAPPTTPPAATPPVATPPVATPPAATTPAVTTPAVTPPAATPPAATPPAATPPAATPPAATPPAATPPAATPPAATPPAATPPAATPPAATTPAATPPAATPPPAAPPPAAPPLPAAPA